jgi:PAS domain S-box-containing protein
VDILTGEPDTTDLRDGEQSLRRPFEELGSLEETMLDITRTKDLSALLHIIVERAARLLRAPSGGLYVCDSEKREVRCVVSYNTPRDYTGTVLNFGEGAAGQVAATGQSLLVDDYRAWAGRSAAFERDQPFTALLSTPLIWQGKITGVIHVLDDKKSRVFTQADLKLLQLFANYAAIAIENGSTLERLRRRGDELATLQATVIDITSAPHDLPSLLEGIVKRAIRLLNAPGGGLDLCDSEKRELRCVVSYNTPHDFRGLVLKYGEGASGRVAETGKPLIIDDYRKWEGAAKVNGAKDLGAILSVPMIWQDRVIGVIQVIEESATRRFTQSDLDLLTFFAAHATIAVENERAFETLQESNQFNTEIIAGACEGVVVYDRELKYVVWNRFMEELTGVRAEKLLGKHIALELFPHLREHGIDLLLKRALAGETVTSPDTPFHVLETGRSGWFSGTYGPHHDSKSKIAGVVGFVRDITDRKKAEELLRQNEERYRIMFENMQNGVAVYEAVDGGKDFIFKDFNQAAEEIEKVRREDVIGKRLLEVFPGVKKFGLFDVLERVWKTGKPESYPAKLYSDERISGWRENYVYKLPSGEVVALYQDITERKKTEERIRLQSEIADNMFEGVVLTRASDGVVIYTNRRFEEMLGYDSGELIGKNIAIVHAPSNGKSPEDLAVEIQTRLKEQGVWSGEVPYIKKDGTPFWCRVNISTFKSSTGEAIWVGANEDITARREAQKELRASEVKYRTLFEKIPHAIYQTTAEGKIEAMNPAFARLLGYGSEKELLGFDVERDMYVNSDDRRRWARELEVRGEIRDAELILKRKDGSRLIALDSAHAVRDDRGNLLYYEGTLTDITDRKRAEEALKESEERYRLLFEKSPIGIGLSTFDGEVVALNRAMEDITGYSIEEYRKIKLAETFENLSDRNRIIELLERDGNVVNYQATLIRKNGTRYDALLNISRVRLAEKDLMQTTCIDITENRRMEARLRALHEHTLQLGSAENLDGIVKYTIDSMKSTLGYDFCDFNIVENGLLVCKGSSGETAKLVSLRQNGPGIISKAAREKATIRVGDTSKEPSYIDRSGPEWKGPPTMLSELSTPVMTDGKTIAVLNVEKAQPNAFSERDQILLETLASHVGSALTRIRQQEKLRLHSEHLEVLVEERTKELRKAERFATVGELAAMVAHDLRNPLQGITAATYNLKKHRGKRVDKVSKEMLHIIDQDIVHADRIVDELLEYSREIHLELKETDVQSITKSALTHVKIPRRIRIVNSTKSQPKIMADAEKMRRIFVNLIENALDAMPRRGALRIESTESHTEMKITFTDTGAGMTRETMESLWTPLFTTKARGIGLGLAISKRFVEAHNGSITVESEAGRGSTFTVKLPKVLVKSEGRV